MERIGPTPVIRGAFVIAAALAATAAIAQAQQLSPTAPGPAANSPRTQHSSIPGTPPFRDTEYGDRPHFGTPDAPSRGYAHYELPSERYGQWYRPRAFGLGKNERCAPDAFRPRGYGNLAARPCTAYRIDYHPFVLENPASDFGPSYYRRQPDQRCSCHDGYCRGGCK
jgi:hypothetical protein